MFALRKDLSILSLVTDMVGCGRSACDGVGGWGQVGEGIWSGM